MSNCSICDRPIAPQKDLDAYDSDRTPCTCYHAMLLTCGLTNQFNKKECLEHKVDWRHVALHHRQEIRELNLEIINLKAIIKRHG